MRPFFRDLWLFLFHPVEYIYTFTYSITKKVHILPYDPAVTKLGEDLVTRINKRFPHLNVVFYGSARLRISGQRDVELMIGEKPSGFSKYVDGLSDIFGSPTKIRKNFIEWHTEMDGCSVELLLADPKLPLYSGPKEATEIMMKNKKLRAKYHILKLSLDGVSEREYKRSRMEFFYKELL